MIHVKPLSWWGLSPDNIHPICWRIGTSLKTIGRRPVSDWYQHCCPAGCISEDVINAFQMNKCTYNLTVMWNQMGSQCRLQTTQLQTAEWCARSYGLWESPELVREQIWFLVWYISDVYHIPCLQRLRFLWFFLPIFKYVERGMDHNNYCDCDIVIVIRGRIIVPPACNEMLQVQGAISNLRLVKRRILSRPFYRFESPSRSARAKLYQI